MKMEYVYKDCPELHMVDKLINNCYLKGDYATCFKGCMKLALKGYSLAQCQVGYFYLRGQGVPIDLKKALYWTKRAYRQGDPDAPENLEVIRQAMAGEHFSFSNQFDLLENSRMVLRLMEKNPGDCQQLPFYYYDILTDGIPVGKISIRIGNNIHTDWNGHIGYEVFPEHRGHSYACAACRLVLEVARFHGMPSLYLTCQEDNIPSYRTIEKLGGQLLWIETPPKTYAYWYEGIGKYRVYRLAL